MRIDLPQCNFKNCRYSFDGNCTNLSKYEWCDYRFAKINAIKEFSERLKTETEFSDTITKFHRHIDELVEEMAGESDE